MRIIGWKAGLAVSALAMSMGTGTAAEAPFLYDERAAGTASYFAALANLASTVMFSGLGEPLVVSPYERDQWLRRAGYVTRPRMPEGAVGSVFAGGTPTLGPRPDARRPETLRWATASFDRSLEPAAQAWTLLKITSPEFHLQFHDMPENKLAALMMIPQARAQARLLDERLTDSNGLFVGRDPDGQLRPPVPRDQAAVLWAVSSLILASTAGRDDYWHRAYRDMVDAEKYRGLAERALSAVERLPPRRAAERAIAIAAAGRFALVTRRRADRERALALAREHARALWAGSAGQLEDRGLRVYGLVEAGRLLGDDGYAEAASQSFRSDLLTLWAPESGIFRDPDGRAATVYTPATVGALIAALNAIGWYATGELAATAAEIYPRFFESAVIRSGLLRASPLSLVSARYLESTPASHFAHPSLPALVNAATAPVFASAVAFESGRWRVDDPRYRTADAMFLTNMLAIRVGRRADPFLPGERLPLTGGE